MTRRLDWQKARARETAREGQLREGSTAGEPEVRPVRVFPWTAAMHARKHGRMRREAAQRARREPEQPAES